MNLLWWLKHSSLSENELKKQCECLQSWFAQFLVQSPSVYQKFPLYLEHSRFTFFMLLTLVYLSLVMNFRCFNRLSLASWRCCTLVLHLFFSASFHLFQHITFSSLCYLAAQRPTLGHWRGGCLTGHMLVTPKFLVPPEGHQGPRNEL